MRLDDCQQPRHELGGEVDVTRPLDVAADGVQEPQRPVGGVVLERAGVCRVREHALAQRGRVAQQEPPALVLAPGLEEQALVGGHRVSRPVAEPRVARDDGRPGDDELVGGESEQGARLVHGSRSPHECPRAGACRRDDLGARRRHVGGIARPGQHRVRVARHELGPERARVPEILAVVQPARRLFAVADAGVPLASGLEAGARDAVRALEHVAV